MTTDDELELRAAREPTPLRPVGRMAELMRDAQARDPSIDWEAMESRLLAAIDDTPKNQASNRSPITHSTQASRRAVGIGVVTFAAAAAVWLWLHPTKTPRDPAQAQVAAVDRASVCEEEASGCASVAVGGTIVAPASGTRALRADGHFVGWLSAGSRATLVEDGARVRFSLETGSISATVTPTKDGEPFAIDVGAIRVGTHGTKIRVARRDHVVDVAVTEGAAVVGTPRNDRTEGSVVPAGFVGSFRDDGGMTIVHDEALAAAWINDGATKLPPAPSTTSTPPAPIEPTAASVAPPTPSSPRISTAKISTASDPVAPPPEPAPSAVASAPTPLTTASPLLEATSTPGTAPSGLTDGDAAPAMSSLASAVCTCVHLGKGDATYSTVVTATVAPAGTLLEAQFSPPLDPRWRDCIARVEHQSTFPLAQGPSIHSRRATCSSTTP
jgi:hypothetical protein